MRRPMLLVIIAALLVPAPVQAERVEHVEYVAGHALAIHCHADPHPWAPQGAPTQHPSAVDWLVSGEPECAGGDAANLARASLGQERVAHGYGGAKTEILPSEHGGTLSVDVDDALYGASESYLLLRISDDQGEVVSEGCGPRSVRIPQPIDWHWEHPPLEAWTFIRVVGVTDDLKVCGATAGTFTAVVDPVA